MKNLILLLFLVLPSLSLSAQNLKPYILGCKSKESVSIVKKTVADNLINNNLDIVGQYQPANDKNRWIIIITCEELQEAVRKFGGLTGFAATLRVGITQENGITLVSYTHPAYWGNAYFRSDYPKVSTNYNSVSYKLTNTMKASGAYAGNSFGSAEGISPEGLHKYHYMMGMPHFDDTEKLEEFATFDNAIAKIEANIKKGVSNVKQVYIVNIPGEKICLYGFSLSGETGEQSFLPVIDIGQPKHTAFLPYELLVVDNEVHMLHGRYRIALSFPDLTMATFSKIMSTPGNIEDLLEQLVK